MSVYLVTWDLNREKQGYDAARKKLIAHLATYDHIKDPGLDSVWFISTAKTAQAVTNDAEPCLDKNDCFVATRMRRDEYYGLLQSKVWEWIAARL